MVVLVSGCLLSTCANVCLVNLMQECCAPGFYFSRIPCLKLTLKPQVHSHPVNELWDWIHPVIKWKGWRLCVRFPEEWQHQSSEDSSCCSLYKLWSCWPRWYGFFRVLGGLCLQVSCWVSADSIPHTAPNICNEMTLGVTCSELSVDSLDFVFFLSVS